LLFQSWQLIGFIRRVNIFTIRACGHNQAYLGHKRDAMPKPCSERDRLREAHYQATLENRGEALQDTSALKMVASFRAIQIL
jgi:hypothetical protein